MHIRSVASIAGVLCALASGAAHADGMGSLKDTPVAIAPSWSGAYFGMSIGYGRNESENNYWDSDGASSSVDEEADGGLVSLIWGFDRIIGDRIVVGAFVDVDWSDIERGDAGNGMTIDRSFAVGGRLGYLVTPSTMLFATAGYTRAHFDSDGWWDISANGGGPILPGKDSENFGGYFVGGGVETRLTQNFYLRGEVRYADYKAETTNSGTYLGTTYVDEEDPELITGRIGLVYKLGRGELPLLRGGDYDDGTIGTVTYYGVDVSKDVWSVYSGGVMALNGDLTRDGVVARTFGYYADYDYTDRVDQTEYNGKDRAMDVMLGYQKYFGTTSVVAYAGMEVRDIDISPDDESNELRGTKTGFKVAAEIETGDEEPVYASLDTSYSTAFNSAFAQLRVGPNISGVKFGPEGVLYSDEGELTGRVGGFAIIPFNLWPSMPAEISFDVGYQFVEDEEGNGNGDSGRVHGGEGAYFGSMLKVLF